MMPMRPPAAQMQGQQMGGGMGMRPMGAPPQQMQAQQAQQGLDSVSSRSRVSLAKPPLLRTIRVSTLQAKNIKIISFASSLPFRLQDKHFWEILFVIGGVLVGSSSRW